MNKIISCCALAVACAAVDARPEAFVGAAVGAGQWPADACGGSCDRRDTVWWVRAGYMFTPYVGIEARYVDLGRARSRQEFAGATLEPEIGAKGAGLGVALALPIAQGWRLTGMAGVARMKTRIDTPDAIVSSTPNVTVVGFQYAVTRSKPYYGLGAEYDVARNLSAGVEAARYRVGQEGSAGVDTIVASLTYRFR